MPNWCSNKLTITGPKADVQAFKTKAVGHSPWEQPEKEPAVLNFHSLVPVPEEVLKAGYESAGYHWEVENWGCKWGAGNATIVDEWPGCILTSLIQPGPHRSNSSKPWRCSGWRWCSSWCMRNLALGFKGLAKFLGEVHEDHCISL